MNDLVLAGHVRDRPLTAKQQLFAQLYALYGVGTQAAIEAGYSATHASSWAAALLRDVRVRALADEHRFARLRARDVTHARIIEEYRRIALSDARTLHASDGSMRGPHEWDEDTAATIAGVEVSQVRTSTSAIGLASDASGRARAGSGYSDDAGAGVQLRTEERTVKVKRYDKLRALDQLAKITGLLQPDHASGSGTARAQGDTADPARIARMGDEELESVLQAARLLGQGTGTGT